MSEVLIEGFNVVANPNPPLYDGSELAEWSTNGGNAPVDDATHKTEGASAWKLVAVDIGGGTYLNTINSSNVDLSTYTSLKVDYYAETVDSSDSIFIVVDSVTNEVAAPSGSGTLTIDISSLSPRNSVQISIGVAATPLTIPYSAHTSTIHIDNLLGVSSGAPTSLARSFGIICG